MLPQQTDTLDETLANEISAILLGTTDSREDEAPKTTVAWLRKFYRSYVRAPFAQFHIDFWDWVESLEQGVRPQPFIALWPRGGGKSVSAELAVIRVGAKKARNYVWYCCETQEQADKHVETLSLMLENELLNSYYPGLGSPSLSKYGRPRGWRRNRIWTESGLIIDGIGLDTATRGARVAENRPGMMVLDDIDSKHDTPKTIQKKIEIITTSLFPAGSTDVAILFVQNVIHSNSIAAMLAEGTADFLLDRNVSGPHPAIKDMTYTQKDGRYIITGGTPAWEGQNMDTCQKQMDSWGFTAFMQEAQHAVEDPPGGIWDNYDFQHIEWKDVPWDSIVRTVIWVDPAVSSTDESDCMGVQADAIDSEGKIYRLYSWEMRTSPEDALRRAILKAISLGAMKVGIETDQGGEAWESVAGRVWDQLIAEGTLSKYQSPLYYDDAKAGAGVGSKVHRNVQMLADYERGQVVHVFGTHTVLERALRRFPRTKPFDLVDAAYWSWADLRDNSPTDAKRFNELGHVPEYRSLWE